MTEPLTPPDCDLRDFPSAYVCISSVFEGPLGLLANDAAFKAGFILMLASWHEVPSCSLPNDDDMLWRLAMMKDRRTWRRIRSEALSEFVLCEDGRFYHGELSKRANSAWGFKLARGRKLIRRLEIESEKWAALRSSIFERDAYTCQYCGSSRVRLECDHVVPVIMGGATDEANLVTACKPCNRSKGSKLLSEWRQ